MTRPTSHVKEWPISSHITFNLTAHIARQQIALRTGMIKQAAREISACPCPEKRWQAMALLRQLQR